MGLGPSVLDGEIRYLSVSQLEKFDPQTFGGCERKWFFRYILKAPEPQKKSQKLGGQCHSQIEHYLKTGEDVLGELTRAGKRFLPEPGPDLMVEHAFGQLRELEPGGLRGPVDSPLSAGGVPLVGLVDLMHIRGEWVNDSGIIEANLFDAAEVVDWKSTVQIADEKDPDTGVVVRRGYAKSAKEIADSWQMMGYAELARLTFPRAAFVRVGHGYFQTRGHRAATKRSELVSVRDVQANWRRADVIVKRMQVVARAASVKDVAPNYDACAAYGRCPYRAQCPRDPKVVLAQLFGGKTMSLLEKIKANRLMRPPINGATTTTAENSMIDVTDSTAVAREIEALKAEEYAAITPPDLPEPEKTAEPIPDGSSLKAPEKVKAKGKKKTSQEASVTVALATDGFTLYLDAAEDGVRAQRLEILADELAQELAAANGAADIQCAPDGTSLAFGKWRGALAAYAREREDILGPYACSSGNEVALVVFNALAPKAARVVRGHR